MLPALKCFKQEYFSIYILVEIQPALHEHEEKESRIRSKKRNITVLFHILIIPFPVVFINFNILSDPGSLEEKKLCIVVQVLSFPN